MIDLLNSNRFKKSCPHGIILGEHGYGVSFIAKAQINELLKEKNTQVYIIDAYGDYNEFCSSRNSKIIKPHLDNLTHIPECDEDDLDIDLQYDFIITFYTILKGKELTISEKSFICKCLKKYKPQTLKELNKILEKEQSNKEELNLVLMAKVFDKPLFNPFDIEKESQLINIDLSTFNKHIKIIAYLFTLFSIYNINKNNQDKQIVLYITNPQIIISNNDLLLFLNKILKRFRRHRGAITLVGSLDDMLSNSESRRIFQNINHVCLLTQNSKNKEIIQSYFPSTEPFLDLIIDKSLKSGVILDGRTTHFFIINEK